MTIDGILPTMVDTRTNFASEKALAYKMKLEAMKRQGQRTDLTSRPLVGKLESADALGENTGESGRQIQRYIRLIELNLILTPWEARAICFFTQKSSAAAHQIKNDLFYGRYSFPVSNVGSTAGLDIVFQLAVFYSFRETTFGYEIDKM